MSVANMIESAEKTRQRNLDICDAYESGNATLTKRASASLDGFVRTKLREDCVMDDVIPSIDIQDSQFTPQEDDDNPSVILDIEPDSPGAVTVPFGRQPTNVVPFGKRYRVRFQRFMTKRFVTDVVRLRTYRYDIREVITDNAVRDMYAEKDSAWFSAVETAVGGASGAVVQYSNVTQWRDIAGGVTPQNIFTMLAQLEETPGKWPVVKVVCNHLFRFQIMRNEPSKAGRGIVEEWIKKGWNSNELFNVVWRSSLKRDIIADNRCYLFTDTENVGHHIALEPVTMSVKHEHFMLSWFAYGSYGAGIANVYGLGISDYV